MSAEGGGLCSRSTQTDQAKSKVINVALFILKSGGFDDLDFKVVRREGGEESVVITYSDLFGVLGEELDPVSITLSCDGVCRVYVLFCPSLSYMLVNQGTFDAKTFVKILKQFQRSTVFCEGIPPQLVPSEPACHPDEVKTHMQPFQRHQAKNCSIYYKTDIEIAEKIGLCQNCQLLLQKLKKRVPSKTLGSVCGGGDEVSNIPTTVCELEVKLEPVSLEGEMETTSPAFTHVLNSYPSTSTSSQELLIAAFNAKNIHQGPGDAGRVSGAPSGDDCNVPQGPGDSESGAKRGQLEGQVKVEPTSDTEVLTENNLEPSISSSQTSLVSDGDNEEVNTIQNTVKATKTETQTGSGRDSTTEVEIKAEMETEEYSEEISHARYPYVAKISTVRKRKQTPRKKSPENGYNSSAAMKKKTRTRAECVSSSAGNTVKASNTENKSPESNKVKTSLAINKVEALPIGSSVHLSSASSTNQKSFEFNLAQTSSAINKGRIPQTDKIVELLQKGVKPFTFNVKMPSKSEMLVMKPATKEPTYDLLRIYKGQEKPAAPPTYTGPMPPPSYTVRLPTPLTTNIVRVPQLPSNTDEKASSDDFDGITHMSNALRMQLRDKLNELQQSGIGQHVRLVAEPQVAQPQPLYGQPQVQHNGLHLLTSVLSSDPSLSQPSVPGPSVSETQLSDGSESTPSVSETSVPDTRVPDTNCTGEESRSESNSDHEADDAKLCAQSLIELANQQPAPILGIPTTVTEMKEIPELKEVKVQKRRNDGHAQCPVCFEFYSSETALLRHVRIHNVDRPFSCPVCNKSFGQKITMKVHMRLHTGEKPHQCYICERSFAQKSNMETHVRRHLGLRPFKCDHCGKGFSDKGTLDEHVKTHTGDQPYLCVVCGKSFSQRSHMRTHMKRHHDNKTPYACKKCTKSFKNKESLKQHVESHN